MKKYTDYIKEEAENLYKQFGDLEKTLTCVNLIYDNTTIFGLKCYWLSVFQYLKETYKK